jgi:molecular chaperone DnaK (HSP70)
MILTAPGYPFDIFKIFLYIVDIAADITVLQTIYNGQLKELCRVTGDDCGATSVDDRFFKMLDEIAGGKLISELKENVHFSYIDLVHYLELVKRSLRTETKTKVSVIIPLVQINKKCQEFGGKDLQSSIDSSSYVNELTLCRDKLRFSADLLKKLFIPTIDSIITLIKNTVSNRSTNGISNNVSNIVMVGAFSDCPIIQDAVYKAFPDNQIIIPEDAGLSVLKGAVLFGHRPDYSRSELCDEEGIGK